jgi:hypothetical protein
MAEQLQVHERLLIQTVTSHQRQRALSNTRAMLTAACIQYLVLEFSKLCQAFAERLEVGVVFMRQL